VSDEALDIGGNQFYEHIIHPFKEERFSQVQIVTHAHNKVMKLLQNMFNYAMASIC
jgi:hypothetical protein